MLSIAVSSFAAALAIDAFFAAVHFTAVAVAVFFAAAFLFTAAVAVAARRRCLRHVLHRSFLTRLHFSLLPCLFSALCSPLASLSLAHGCGC